MKDTSKIISSFIIFLIILLSLLIFYNVYSIYKIRKDNVYIPPNSVGVFPEYYK